MGNSQDLLLAAYWAADYSWYTGPFGGAGPTWARALDLGLHRDPQTLDGAFGLAFASLDPRLPRTPLALAGAYLALGGNPQNLRAWGFNDLQAARALARGLTAWTRGRLFFSPWYARS